MKKGLLREISVAVTVMLFYGMVLEASQTGPHGRPIPITRIQYTDVCAFAAKPNLSIKMARSVGQDFNKTLQEDQVDSDYFSPEEVFACLSIKGSNRRDFDNHRNIYTTLVEFFYKGIPAPIAQFDVLYDTATTEYNIFRHDLNETDAKSLIDGWQKLKLKDGKKFILSKPIDLQDGSGKKTFYLSVYGRVPKSVYEGGIAIIIRFSMEDVSKLDSVFDAGGTQDAVDKGSW